MNKLFKVLIIFLLTGACALFLTGCEKQARYKVLTFFFTGVPPIDGKVKDNAVQTAAVKKPKKRQVYPAFVHGPKASGECFYCHDTDSTQSFKQTKKSRGGGMPNLKDIKPGRLIVDRKDLCVQCHTSKSSEMRYVEDLWIHGPLAEGSCTACHDYHETRFRYMLRKESSIDLCTRCHADGFLEQTEEHTNGEECTSCHNPHIGANRLLLRKDFDEVF